MKKIIQEGLRNIGRRTAIQTKEKNLGFGGLVVRAR